MATGYIQTAGPTVLLSTVAKTSGSTAGTTASVGDWYRLHPKIGRLAFSALGVAASVGASINSTIYIEMSNDGTYPIATKGLTFALTNTTTTFDCQGGCLATSLFGQWGYIRANMNSLSTATAGTTGQGSITVIVSAAPVANAP